MNQFTVREGSHTRRPDVVVFVNGLPLAVLELKNAADVEATLDDAFHQLGTYKDQIPSLFHYNELLVVGDGPRARIGSLTAGQEWFKPWPTIMDRPDISILSDEFLEEVRALPYQNVAVERRRDLRFRGGPLAYSRRVGPVFSPTGEIASASILAAPNAGVKEGGGGGVAWREPPTRSCLVWQFC